MVYCGKPSKGCSNCRQRKIRCDRGDPACGQCIKIQKDCPGYRNMLDLAFRDESEDVVRKAKAKSRKSPPTSTEVSCHRGSPRANAPDSYSAVPSASLASDDSSLSCPYQVDWLDIDAATTSVPFSLHTATEDNAFNYFIFNFVKSPIGPSRGYFAYIEDMYRDGSIDDALQAAITASGLAGMATTSKSSQLMAKARREYAIALQRINTALRSPTESLKDTILLAIIIIAIFETIVGAKQLSLKEWTEHVNGAATLIKLRGRDQLKNQASLDLFMHATSHVMLSCIQREIAMPPQLIELRNEAFNCVAMDPGYQFMRLADELSTFRSSVKTGAFQDSQAVITRALSLDRELAQIYTDIPPGWAYEPVYTETDCEYVFGGTLDIYFDHWVSQMWNAMRASRLMLHETIRTQLIKDCVSENPRFSAEYFQMQFGASADVCKEMRDGILRSVPQHLGFVTRKPFMSPTVSSLPLASDVFSEVPADIPDLDFNPSFSFSDLLLDEPFATTLPQPETLRQDPAHPSIGGFFLLWPLYVAGATRVNTSAHREFVLKTLRYIGDTMGLRAGSGLAAFMQASSMTSPTWTTKVHPGVIRKQPMALLNGEMKRPLMELLAKEERERIERVVALRTGGQAGVSICST